jgi:hypothetical protein
MTEKIWITGASGWLLKRYYSTVSRQLENKAHPPPQSLFRSPNWKANSKPSLRANQCVTRAGHWAWGYNVRSPTCQFLLFLMSAWLCTEWKLANPFGSGIEFTALSSDGVRRWTNCLSAATSMCVKLSLPCKGPTKGLMKWVYSENRMFKAIIEPKGETVRDSWRKLLTGKHRGLLSWWVLLQVRRNTYYVTLIRVRATIVAVRKE